jgi:flagellar secretion chaperone FliS
MRQYQEQAVSSATPEQLVAKLYDLGIAACHREDRPKLRAVLVELISGLNFEQGGDIAERLFALYQYCLTESVSGRLDVICELLTGLRDAWREGVLMQAA